MPLKPSKILNIILDECESINERYDGYKKDFVYLITDIIEDERKHIAQGTNIQQQINEKCDVAGDLLAESRGQTNLASGEDS